MSLVEGERGKVSVEMFDPSDEDVIIPKNTHAALVHPMEVEENYGNQSRQEDEISCSVRKMTGTATISSVRRLGTI